MKSLTTNAIAQALGVGVVLTGVSYLVALAAGWITELNWLEVFAVFTSYSATYLSIKQKRFYYIAGIISTAAYVIVFMQSNLLASAVLNGYLSVTLIYGYFRWGKDSNTRPVHHLRFRWAPVYLLVTAALYAGAVLITTLLGGSFAFWDAAILACTILAQLLLDQKVIETWWVWLVGVNTVGVILYFSSGLYLVAIQQLIFWGANFWGFYQWRKSIKVEEDVPKRSTYVTP